MGITFDGGGLTPNGVPSPYSDSNMLHTEKAVKFCSQNCRETATSIHNLEGQTRLFFSQANGGKDAQNYLGTVVL